MTEIPLSKIITLQKGKIPKNRSFEFRDGFLPNIDIKAFEHGIFEYYTDGKGCVFCEDDDILIVCDGARSGLVGKAKKGVVGSTLAKIEVPSYINKDFIFYFIKWHYRELNTNMKGTGTPHVNPELLGAFLFPLFSESEQQRIVAKIDALFSELDKGVEMLETIRQQLKTYRQAVLKWAFEGKLTEDNSDEWSNTTLGNICKITSGGTPSRSNPKYYTGKIPWIKTGELNWNTIFDSEEHITDDAISNSSAKKFPIGTVLVAMYGQGLTRGRAAILGIEATTNQAVCALIPSSKINTKYLFYFFRNIYWDLREMAMGGNQLNLSATLIANIKITLPLLEEQTAIVEAIESRLSVCDKLEQLINENLAKTTALRQSILKKAFAGKLVPQDPNDEPAEVLLERIKKEKNTSNSYQNRKKTKHNY